MSANNLTAAMLAAAREAIGCAPGKCAPKPLNQCNVYVRGGFRSGKTSLAAQVPDSLLMDLQGGTVAIVGQRAERVYCPVLSDDLLTETAKVEHKARSVMGVLGATLHLAQEGKCPFRTIVIDNVDELEAMQAALLTSVKGANYFLNQDFGNADRHLATMVIPLLQSINAAGLSWWVNSQVRTSMALVGTGKSAQSIEYERPSPVKELRHYLIGWADLPLVARKSITDNGDGSFTKEFWLETEQEPNTLNSRTNVPQGCRVPLPPRIAVEEGRAYDMLAVEYDNAVKKQLELDAQLRAK